MAKKILEIEINCCIACEPYCRNVGLGYCCQHPEFPKNVDNRIIDVRIFLPDCPLEDAKE